MLARDLGLTVEQMRDTMTTREFMEWAAFYQLEAERQQQAHSRAQAKARMRGR